MTSIGEELVQSTKQRFATSTAPDESHWVLLKEGTVLARLHKILFTYHAYTNLRTKKEGAVRGGLKKSFANKDGTLNKSGRAAFARGAKASPLVDTGGLSRSIRYRLTDG